MVDIVASGEAVKTWQELQELVRALVPKESQSVPKIQWLASGRLVLIGPWQVEAHFAENGGKYEIRFQRFGGDLTRANYEPTPGGRIKDPDVWKLEPVRGTTRIFWRLSNFADLTPETLANRVVERLKTYYEEYKVVAIGD